MRVNTLLLIFFILLIPDVLFVGYFAFDPTTVQLFVESYIPRWILGGLADNPVAVIVFFAFLYAIVFGSALLYVLVSSIFKRLGRTNEQ
ncbi:MAG: hypothetical protein HYU39_11000 [Thaumarchaeota archaeon]|nr:hypothetical protein [Nitrososphaerota archaeon]